jgi:hypothetical protein
MARPNHRRRGNREGALKPERISPVDHLRRHALREAAGSAMEKVAWWLIPVPCKACRHSTRRPHRGRKCWGSAAADGFKRSSSSLIERRPCANLGRRFISIIAYQSDDIAKGAHFWKHCARAIPHRTSRYADGRSSSPRSSRWHARTTLGSSCSET